MSCSVLTGSRTCATYLSRMVVRRLPCLGQQIFGHVDPVGRVNPATLHQCPRPGSEIDSRGVQVLAPCVLVPVGKHKEQSFHLHAAACLQKLSEPPGPSRRGGVPPGAEGGRPHRRRWQVRRRSLFCRDCTGIDCTECAHGQESTGSYAVLREIASPRSSSPVPFPGAAPKLHFEPVVVTVLPTSEIV